MPKRRPDKLSDRGLRMIKAHEALRLFTYDDFAPNTPWTGGKIRGTLTIGYGNTRNALPARNITKTEAIALLHEDVQVAVNDVLQTTAGIELEQHEFDALVSLVFNIGRTNFANSTLLRLLEQGKRREAANEFLRWRMSKGKVLAGLEKRRADERTVFLGLHLDPTIY